MTHSEDGVADVTARHLHFLDDVSHFVDVFAEAWRVVVDVTDVDDDGGGVVELVVEHAVPQLEPARTLQ